MAQKEGTISGCDVLCSGSCAVFRFNSFLVAVTRQCNPLYRCTLDALAILAACLYLFRFLCICRRLLLLPGSSRCSQESVGCDMMGGWSCVALLCPPFPGFQAYTRNPLFCATICWLRPSPPNPDPTPFRLLSPRREALPSYAVLRPTQSSTRDRRWQRDAIASLCCGRGGYARARRSN